MNTQLDLIKRGCNNISMNQVLLNINIIDIIRYGRQINKKGFLFISRK